MTAEQARTLADQFTGGTSIDAVLAEAEHAPDGPWWVTSYGIRDRGGYLCQTIKAQRYEGQEERYVREVAERFAQARLMAAAPDLLEALQEVSAFAAAPASLSADHDAVLAKVRAAIVKATQS